MVDHRPVKVAEMGAAEIDVKVESEMVEERETLKTGRSDICRDISTAALAARNYCRWM